jgi:YD repeat-containing protein
MLGAILTTNPDDSAALRFRDGVTYDFVRLTPPTEVDITVLSSIVDPNGNTITITRNPGDANQITAITDAVGRQLLFTYNAADLITSITDPMGRTVYYTYTGAPSGPGGFLETFTDQNGGVWQYAYNDVTGNLLTLTDPRGVLVEQNTYDANYRVVSQLQADGSTIQLSYSLVNPLVPSAPVISTVVTDQLGRQSTYRFNPQGFLAQVTDPLGQTRVFTRAQGTNLLLSMTGPGVCDVCGDPTEGDTFFTYDSQRKCSH